MNHSVHSLYFDFIRGSQYIGGTTSGSEHWDIDYVT